MDKYELLIFGGTFDPVHVGHLGITHEVAHRLGVRRVLLLPTAGNPLKNSASATAKQRLDMLRLAIAGDDLFEICDYELFRAPPTYTIDTLEWLASEGLLKTRTGFVIGADSLKDIHRWRRVDELLTLVDIIVAARPPEDFESVRKKIDALEPRFGREMVELMKRNTVKTGMYDISSTDIRRRATSGESLKNLVAPAVEEYIVKNNIYCGCKNSAK